MILVNHKHVIDGLREFGSESEQRRLWLGEGNASDEISSFVEARHGLFADSCVIEKINAGGTEFGPEVDALLTDLKELTEAISYDRSEKEVIADRSMIRVRATAANALARIMSKGMRNSDRIADRVIEWRDEDRQKKLWLPASEGQSPKSSPADAAWHLFLGNDCWEYLALGPHRRELSKMFYDLAHLVYDIESLHFLPPVQVIANPRMWPVRQLAAEIAEGLAVG